MKNILNKCLTFQRKGLGCSEMKELEWRGSIADKLRRLGFQVDLIENSASNGMPDMHIFNKIDVWMELKVCETHTTKAELRASQFNWHHKRNLTGGDSLVAILNKKNDTVSLFEFWQILRDMNEKKIPTGLTIQGQAKFCVKRTDFVDKFLETYCRRNNDELPTNPVNFRDISMAPAGRTSVVAP